MSDNERLTIKEAMIDAAGATRCGGPESFTLSILETLAPLVDGWLPDCVIRNELGKIVVLPR